MKKSILFAFMLMFGAISIKAQSCCNVVSGGLAVVTTNGLCVVASGAGCLEADTDGDGFADSVDNCPNEPGENNGCPELNEDEKMVLMAALEGVKFKTDSDELLDESFNKLDAIVSLMKKHPDFNLKISGYTDNSGDADYNLTLSDKRAHSAEQYIIFKGIASSRIMAKGYGEADPVADNGTAEGRAKNRRVDFKLISK